jgi:thymidylate kinase
MFILVSGIPGSGKTDLGARLSSALALPFLDKDDFLDRLLSAEQTVAAARRRTLSRESDVLFQRAAMRADAAVLVSFWRVPGMPADSGTPMAWLAELPRTLIQVYCACPPQIAARRFLARERHPAHGDQEHTYESLIAAFQDLASLGPPTIPRTVRVDTAQPVNLSVLVDHIRVQLSAA